jgi:hypothetical protein
MIKNKMLSIMLVVSMALLFTGISLGDVYLSTPYTVVSPDTWSVSSLRIENGGSLTVEFGATFIDTGRETFMAANNVEVDMTASMYVFGTATVAGEFKMGQYEISVDGDENPIVGSVGDNATLVVGNGVNVATMHVAYLETSSSGGVTTININTNGTLTADDGHINPGTSVNLLGGTFKVKNKAGGTVTDIPESELLAGVFGHLGLTIAEGGVIVTTEGEYTVYTDSCTAAKNDAANPYLLADALSIGDTNYDCIVNLGDFAGMASTWLNAGTDEADLDDLGVLALNWLTDVTVVPAE